MTAAILIESLSKTYPKNLLRPAVDAVRDVSLRIEAGEVFGFIGPNGAGKSTTIKILTGMVQPSAGRVEIFGVSASDPESRRHVGYVPENPLLFDYLTPFETLLMGVRLHGLRPDDERGHCLGWLEKLGLKEVADKTIRSFSKGMTQRVALALALAVQPRLLILDEPLSGLDPAGRREVVDLLADFKRGGGTIFLTSHVLHDVERLADRFGLIDLGRMQTLQSPADLVGAEERVLVRSLGERPLAGMQAEGMQRWCVEKPRAELWPFLRELDAAGHELIEIRPLLTLEALFLKQIGKP